MTQIDVAVIGGGAAGLAAALDLPSRRQRVLKGTTMTSTSTTRPAVTRPPTKHELAVMIWLAVFPTLTVLNLALGDWLSTLSPILRTFVLATVAVPIVIYGLMPQLHRLRARVVTRTTSATKQGHTS
jgi:antibiotic biosynthesis monooxygenase (ABM) superfamily enzyme